MTLKTKNAFFAGSYLGILLILFWITWIGSSTGYSGALTITSPNGGEKYKCGTTEIIRWTGSDISEKVVILLYKKGIMQSVIAENTSNTGSYEWKISCEIPEGKDYRIRIRDLKNLSMNDFSDGDFTIVK